MSKDLIHLTGDYWGVEVPPTANGFRVLDHHCALWYIVPPLRGYSTVDLPIGQWEIVVLAKDTTIPQRCDIVDIFNNGAFRDYSYGNFDPCDELMPMLLTSEESLHSLLKSKNLNPSTTLIIKLLNNG